MLTSSRHDARLLKGIAEHVRNTSTFEQTVLAGVLNVVFDRADTMDYRDSLLGRRAVLPECHSATVADKAVIRSFEVTRGDVIAHGDAIGITVACFEEDGEIGVLVETTSLRGRLGAHTVRVERSGSMAAWSTGGIALCLAWKAVSETELVVVVR